MTLAPIKSGFEKSPTLKAENSQLRIVQTFVSWQLIAPEGSWPGGAGRDRPDQPCHTATPAGAERR
jgi:hypothetical protein